MPKSLIIILCVLCCLALIIVLVTTKKSSPDPAPAETPTPRPTVTVTATIAPTPTPIPLLTSGQYVLQWKNDAERGMNYMLPTHWEQTASGDRYRVYSEPTPDGVSGFRVAFVNKKKASTPDANKMRAELRQLMAEMEAVYTDFHWNGEISRDYMLVKFKGYSGEYTYTDDNGEPMQGFVIIATYDRRVYCVNFSGPVARFADMKSIMLKLVESVSRVK